MRSLKTNAVLNIIQSICKVIFPLITIPYASRVLEAANYGKVSFGNSIVRYFILLAALGISTYAQREAPGIREDKIKIAAFSNQVFTINVYATLLSYVILFFLLVSSYKLKDYTMLILIQSSAIILNTLGADWINVVYEDYFYITVRYIAMQCVSLLLLFVFVRTPKDFYWYAAINVIAAAGGNLFNIFYIRRYVRLHVVRIKDCIRHLKPVLLLFCVSITTVIYISSDITILGLFMGDTDVGIYTMASNIYSVVKQVISAVIVVGIPRMAYYLGNERSEDYHILAKKVLNSLISLLLPAIAGLSFLSFDILNVMGGSEYVGGQTSLIILAGALLFAILAGFYSNSYLLLVKKDNIYLFATSLSAAINIGLNFVLIPKCGIAGAAVTTLLAELTMTAVSFRQAFKEYRLLVSRSILISSGIGALLVAIICRTVCMFEISSILRILLSFIISCIVYYLVLKALKNPLADSVDDMAGKVIRKALGR